VTVRIGVVRKSKKNPQQHGSTRENALGGIYALGGEEREKEEESNG